jgi:hypothetical protein
MRNKLEVSNELEIIKLKNNGTKNKDIMLLYGIKNVKTIYDVLKRNGREKIIGNKKYYCNDKYFEEINTEEKAYWLGFLYADGYVRMNKGRSGVLRLKLKNTDKPHIEKFNKCLDSNYLIKEMESKVKYKLGYSISYCSCLVISNTKIVKDLYKLGCLSNKTFKISFPNIEINMIRHFIRGYFDGDGSAFISNNRIGCSFTSGSNLFLEQIKEILCSELNIGNSKITKYKNANKISWTAKEDIIKISSYFYEDSNIYLNRKKEIFNS